MKNIRRFFKGKRGVALVGVILFCTVLITMLSFLYYNTKVKRASQVFQYDTTRALMAANAAVQLAIYKYRVLPSEYYKINEIELDLRLKNQSLDSEELVYAKNIWLRDLCTKSDPASDENNDLKEENSAVTTIKKCFGDFTNEGKDYDFGVSSFELVSLNKNGYTKDYIKIKAWGMYNNKRKDVEELIEISVVK